MRLGVPVPIREYLIFKFIFLSFLHTGPMDCYQLSLFLVSLIFAFPFPHCTLNPPPPPHYSTSISASHLPLDFLCPHPLYVSVKCLSLTVSTCSLLLCTYPLTYPPCPKANAPPPPPQTAVSPQHRATMWHAAINMSTHRHTHKHTYTHYKYHACVQNTLLQYKYLSINA